MGLKFPQNQDLLQTGGLDGRTTNSLGRVWHGFFEAVYRKLSAVEGVTNIATPAIGAAGVSYNQAYAQSQTDKINEIQEKLNALQSALKTGG